MITEAREGVSFQVLVQPKAAKDEVTGLQGGSLRLRLTAPPVEGKLKVPRSRLDIAGGQHGRRKTVLVAGMSREELLRGLAKLGIEVSS